jgi:hypothetical protein
MKHLADTELALYSSGDLPAWPRLRAALHVRSCDACRAGVDAYRADAEYLRAGASELPEGVEWDRLSAEMSANIHLGLAAGECVTPRESKQVLWSWKLDWRPFAIAAGMIVVLASAWWLNMPRGDTEALRDVFARIANPQESGPMVRASESGVQFRENGTVMGVALADAEPLTVTVSNTGASARYVDDDTDHVVITTVYVP